MSIVKYTIKYLSLCLIAVVIIFCIGALVYSQRTPKEPDLIASSEIESELSIPHLSKQRASSAGHFHADGTFHAEVHQVSNVNNNETVSKRIASSRSSRQTAANQSSLGWITWKYGHTSIRSSSPYTPDWTPLPQEIKDAVQLLIREQDGREWLQAEVLENKDILKNRNELSDYIIFIGKVRNLPDPHELLLDKAGNPLSPLSESEYAAEELRRLVGDRDVEASVDFLSQHGHYNALLLSRLDDESAFDYLYDISLPIGTSVFQSQTRMYAERLVSSDPTHLKARLYLADTSSRAAGEHASVLEQYESILVDHPDSAHALIEAASLLSYLERPFQAVAYFERGHELGARQGHFGAGRSYQQLGDYKTAWVYLKKALQVTKGHQHFRVLMHLDAIEAGSPRIAPLPVEKLDIAAKTSLQSSFSSDTDFAWDLPLSENNVPHLLDSDLAREAAASETAKAQARIEAEAAHRKEIEMLRQMSMEELEAFIEWADGQLRDEVSASQTTDFLGREMAAHLSGKNAQFSPQRIVRANELIKRYGYEEGLSRMSKDDPEIALQIQLLRKQETIPNRKNMKKVSHR